jgi:[acyl-carrier-protein] S-malonyltransferase
MTKKLLALFPGQGSQKVGMGKDLAEKSDIARSFFERADKAAGFPLSKICFEGPVERLTATEVTQPAILAVSVIAYEIAKSIHGAALAPVAAAGHSLGEYSAYVAAGALSFDDAVALVHKRGRYMQEAVPAGRGKMVAVLGKEPAELEPLAAAAKSGIAQIANVNAAGQVVVAGDVAGIDEFVAKLVGAKVMPLQVSAPFHCVLMKPAEEKLSKDLDAVTISRAAFPIYANYSAAAAQEPADIRRLLKQQVCGRVRWVECMQHAIAEKKPDVAVEFGAGNVLAGLLKRIAPELARTGAGTPEAIQELAAAL